MPFQSKAQIRACYAQKSRAEKEGRVATWDCKKWYAETKSPKKLNQRKIYTGPRGGKYFIKDGKKNYIK
jgi:hypothetical protein